MKEPLILAILLTNTSILNHNAGHFDKKEEEDTYSTEVKEGAGAELESYAMEYTPLPHQMPLTAMNDVIFN